MNTLCVIPARFASTRLPGKPLADIAGKPMIARVYEQASKAKRITQVIAAVDDQRVFDAVGKTYGKINIKCPHCKRLVSIKLKVMKENKLLTHN